MAMEKQYVIRETHTRAITAIGYNPVRREILMGCEDGLIKCWESETGKLLLTSLEHKGWVTDFLYWLEPKLVFSSANDGFIVAWGSGGGVYDKVHIGLPVYCMAINPRRHQLVCGVNGGIRVYMLDEGKECGHVINTKPLYIASEHTDIVRNIICNESRIYSAGYDQKMVIYDSSYTGDNSLEPIFINHQAHDAGISCLLLARDNENNTWILTGSFDKSVKIWSVDGKFVHKLDNFISTVSGICYIPRNKIVWVAGGTSYASLFDPKSGDNVSDFIGTFQNQEEEKYHLQILKFFPELNQCVATTSRRHLIVWKYNSSGCITALKCKAPLESLCYTKKVPLLIFSGDSEGAIIKWERMQSNHFMYSKETCQLSDSILKKKRNGSAKSSRNVKNENERVSTPGSTASEQNQYNQSKEKVITSHYAFNKSNIPPLSSHKHPNTTILKILFIERLDYILAASEDSNIYVWGFDEAAVLVLKNMKPQDIDNLVHRYSVLLDIDSEIHPKNQTSKETSDSVTNRVAGFICKAVFSEHMSCVTSMVCVGRDHGQKGTYVVSAGWDRRICIWDLETNQLHDTFRNTQRSFENLELASDGIILDLTYSPKTNEIAYSSSDKMVYIRKFSTNGSRMTLVNTLQGHEGEVTVVKWNSIRNKWVTGSEDGTVRIWSSEGFNECEQILSVQGGVCCLCIDKIHGSIIAGIQSIIRVYEPEFYRLVQTNIGHGDAVRSIIHIAERSQYVSSSWDKTIRVWNAWKLPNRNKAGTGKQGIVLETVTEDLDHEVEETEDEVVAEETLVIEEDE
ncbi:uncharacterized WD repeat-containing protein alr3466 [Patella vulgata]|uniref:uncharacterized WD repeat-containing protein alr3466 n=1 Tax=Patella vulgata TaxID=6465 RepID=UPI0021807054|nr:uncharacterized WD repeat-containing protein alr3466 [Patella vulgata]